MMEIHSLLYEVMKSVQGSFNQGDIRFKESAGQQCSCIALYAVCWSVVKRVSCWKSFDLDYILVQGDKLYKSLGKDHYLNVDELPRIFQIFGCEVCVNISELQLFDGVAVPGEDFLHRFLQHYETSVIAGSLLMINSYTIGIIPSFSPIGNITSFFVFDSHSRNSLGIPTVDGFSLLMQFSDLTQIERYLQVAYEVSSLSHPTYFQMQHLHVNIIHDDLITIRNSYERERHTKNENARYAQLSNTIAHSLMKDKKKKHAALVRSTIHGSPKHEHVKFKDRLRKRSLFADTTSKVVSFKKLICEGPYFVCVVCNRCLYKQSVMIFHACKYNPFSWNLINSHDSKHYVCKTCHNKLIKGNIPCQAVSNKLALYNFPTDMQNIRHLERVLIAKRLLFKKIAIMPKGQFPKLKGVICNVPINSENVCNTLPRPADSNGLVMVRLKRKLAYSGHVYFEAVRPVFINRLLQYLKNNNPLYANVEIDISSIPKDVMDQGHQKVLIVDQEGVQEYIDINEPIPLETESVDSNNLGGLIQNSLEPETCYDEIENPLDAYRITGNETALIPVGPTDHEISNIAPGEGINPIPILNDIYCEELAHPHLFPTGKFGYKVQRDIPLSPVKYFNQRLLNYTQKFASDSDYIFFAHMILLKLNLASQINIAMRKISANDLTAGVLTKNFTEKVKQFIADDKAFSFMKSIKGTPAYWKNFLLEVLAMVKQLGVPTFFLTLSCADLRWNELISILSKLNNLNLSEEDIQNLSYHERCKLLNSNPVLLARHFQFRVETFFKEIILDGPLGKTKYYAIRVEFQVRGSPHIHSFVWIDDAPLLTRNNKAEYINFVDSIIHAYLPDCREAPMLFELVKTYQLHRHSRTCCKYRNKECRFNFGKFFSSRTIVAEPLPHDMSDEERTVIMDKRNDILAKVKEYINSNLNPAKVNFYDSSRDDFVTVKSISEVLQELNIDESEYETALKISDDNDFQIFLKRPTNSCFVNNYFDIGLLAWEANIDIQPVFNQYKAITYMCSYLSKQEDACSHAMTQAMKEATEDNLNMHQKLRNVARVYANNRECSVQEAVYHIMPQLWLRKIFPAVLNVISCIPDKRIKVMLTRKEIAELPDESTQLYKRNMLDRYMERPVHGTCAVLQDMCFSHFVKRYQLSKKLDDNDCQPNELKDELIEGNHCCIEGFPKVINLGKNEKLVCRKVDFVLRYHVPNEYKFPEQYAHHLLFMFFPFRSESELKSSNPPSYLAKLNEPGVIQTINYNKTLVEPFGDLVDRAFSQFQSHRECNFDSFAQQENDNTEEDFQSLDVHEVNSEYNIQVSSDVISRQYMIDILCDDEINKKVRSLNIEQRKIFDYVYNWAKTLVKNLSSKSPRKIHAFHLFLSGSGGCGKSHLIRTIYHALTKLFMYHHSDPTKSKVLILAPTGVAAINIGGTTLHSALHIPCHGKLLPLNDSKKAILRNKYSDVQLIVIDEISMVSSRLLLQVHQRLLEIFNESQVAFAGKSVILCGDLYQLPPVGAKSLYILDNNINVINGMLSLDLWRKFKLAELTQVMRQRNEFEFVEILNKVRIGEIDEHVEKKLKSRFISQDDPSYPHKALHIFAENNPVQAHNMKMLNTISSSLVTIPAIDDIPKNCKVADIEEAQNRRQSETGGLALLLHVKVEARVMITTNIDISDRLINGQLGTVKQFKTQNGKVQVIYIEMDDNKAGISKINKGDFIAKNNNWVPITREETFIYIKSHKSSFSPSIRRTQFPCMLAWACTVHKVQGLSLEEGVVSFNLEKQRSFNQGQMYVALSRITKFDKLFLTGHFNSRAVKANEYAHKEYCRLRKDSMFEPGSTAVSEEGSLTILLLNVRSLKKHAIDIMHDSRIKYFDVLCLTETQLSVDEDIAHISNSLDCFQTHFNCSNHIFSSLAICIGNSVNAFNHIKLTGFSIIDVYKASFSNEIITLLILYRRPSCSTNSFLNTLTELVFSDRKIDIVLGDYNIDAFGPLASSVTNILSNFVQIVSEPTHLNGTLIDHIYVRKSVLETFSIDYCSVITVSFSDHDAIGFSLTKNV